MNHEAVIASLGCRYSALSAVSGFVETPLSIPGDGALIGAYLVQAPDGKIKITDDSDILFNAMTHGVEPTPSRAKAFRNIAHACGATLSNDGELHLFCEPSMVGYSIARFVEAADRIAYLSMGFRPRKSSRFERLVGDALSKEFGDRVRLNTTLVGASGHELRFPFSVEDSSGVPVVIQTVAADEGRPKWANIYNAYGKLADLKNNSAQASRRVALIEHTTDAADRQAKTALADTASVAIFETGMDLQSVLRHAA